MSIEGGTGRSFPSGRPPSSVRYLKAPAVLVAERDAEVARRLESMVTDIERHGADALRR
jgi:hypothetical protein